MIRFLECLKKNGNLLCIADKVYVYAKMKKDEDNSNPASQERADKADSLTTEVISSTSFIVPEIISIPEEKLKMFLSENAELSLYQQYFSDILRQKKHILSEREEELLGMAHDISSNAKNIFTMFNNADIKFPVISDENGSKIELTKGRYIHFLESNDRKIRKNAFDALYKTYSKHGNTLSAMLSGNVKCNKFYSNARKYNSILEGSLNDDNVTPNVYNTLIDTTTKHIHLLDRYLNLRKKALKLKELHMYDLFVPLVGDVSRNIPYEEALNIVAEGLAPLGADYLDVLRNSYKSGWIDVCENEGKTSGAYSWGAYLTHPYVLLNYQGTLNDVFTLAHEMGHALHSYYTNKTQPYIYSEYKIFVAEVASTVNEALLTKHLLSISNDKNEKAFVLTHFLDEFRGTIFRQVMFAEFEKLIHERVESGESLSFESLSNIYYELNLKYYGNSVRVDKSISLEWARIPHFYNSFYVYKYATGLSSALSLSKQMLDEGKPAVDRYLGFLKSGSSDYPLELLKKAGVDLSSSKPLEDAFKVFEENLDRLEECL